MGWGGSGLGRKLQQERRAAGARQSAATSSARHGTTDWSELHEIVVIEIIRWGGLAEVSPLALWWRMRILGYDLTYGSVQAYIHTLCARDHVQRPDRRFSWDAIQWVVTPLIEDLGGLAQVSPTALWLRLLEGERYNVSYKAVECYLRRRRKREHVEPSVRQFDWVAVGWLVTRHIEDLGGLAEVSPRALWRRLREGEGYDLTEESVKSYLKHRRDGQRQAAAGVPTAGRMTRSGRKRKAVEYLDL